MCCDHGNGTASLLVDDVVVWTAAGIDGAAFGQKQTFRFTVVDDGRMPPLKAPPPPPPATSGETSGATVDGSDDGDGAATSGVGALDDPGAVAGAGAGADDARGVDVDLGGGDERGFRGNMGLLLGSTLAGAVTLTCFACICARWLSGASSFHFGGGGGGVFTSKKVDELDNCGRSKSGSGGSGGGNEVISSSLRMSSSNALSSSSSSNSSSSSRRLLLPPPDRSDGVVSISVKPRAEAHEPHPTFSPKSSSKVAAVEVDREGTFATVQQIAAAAEHERCAVGVDGGGGPETMVTMLTLTDPSGGGENVYSQRPHFLVSDDDRTHVQQRQESSSSSLLSSSSMPTTAIGQHHRHRMGQRVRRGQEKNDTKRRAHSAAAGAADASGAIVEELVEDDDEEEEEDDDDIYYADAIDGGFLTTRGYHRARTRSGEDISAADGDDLLTVYPLTAYDPQTTGRAVSGAHSPSWIGLAIDAEPALEHLGDGGDDEDAADVVGVGSDTYGTCTAGITKTSPTKSRADDKSPTGTNKSSTARRFEGSRGERGRLRGGGLARRVARGALNALRRVGGAAARVTGRSSAEVGEDEGNGEGDRDGLGGEDRACPPI